MSSTNPNIWMPTYWGDLLRDTMHLSRAQFGSYMLLIGDYWVKRKPLPDNETYLRNVGRYTGRYGIREWSVDRPILASLFQVRDGFWFHKRVEQELAIASNNKQKAAQRTENACKARWKKSSVTDTVTFTPSPSPSPSPVQAEREQGGNFPEASRPGESEVLARAAFIGLAPWKASDWYHEMQGCGWLDHNQRPVRCWESILTRVKTKWEADGRPSQPASRNSPAGKEPALDKPMKVFELRAVMEAKQAEATRLRNTHFSQVAMGGVWDDDQARKTFAALSAEIKQLNRRISRMA